MELVWSVAKDLTITVEIIPRFFAFRRAGRTSFDILVWRARQIGHSHPSLYRGIAQAVHLNASISVDDDGIDSLPMVYAWNCADESTGSKCVSPSRDALDLSSFAVGGLLSVPGGALPIGESEGAHCCTTAFGNL